MSQWVHNLCIGIAVPFIATQKQTNHKLGTHLNTVALLSTVQVPSHIKTLSIHVSLSSLLKEDEHCCGLHWRSNWEFLLPNRSAQPLADQTSYNVRAVTTLRLSLPFSTTASLTDRNSRFPFSSIDKYTHKTAPSSLDGVIFFLALFLELLHYGR